MAERELTYTEAVLEATEQEMARDRSVFVMGLGVDDPAAVFGTTKGLLRRFGPSRVFSTPLSEDAMTGVAIGAALGGMRPIHVHLRMDFILLAMNQLVNVAAKLRYMTGGAVSVPMVVRAVVGRSWGQGGQHSQSLYPMFMHVPGLKVAAPVSAYDAKGLLVQSIRDDNPVIFVEHRMLHRRKGPVPEDLYTVPFGKARTLADGADVTIVGVSYAAVEALRARELLLDKGVRAEVIDPVTLSPLDVDAIEASARKTGRLLVVDTAWTACGAGAEIIARTAERLPEGSSVRFRRLGFAPTTCPTTKNLENLFYPDSRGIAAAAYELASGDKSWSPEDKELPEISDFRGQF